MKKGLIIIPCFNEFNSIFIFHKEVSKVINNTHIKIDLLFLNDGSTDETDIALKTLYKNNDNISYINFNKNYGKNKIIFNSLKYTFNYNFIIFMDADLQHDPKYIINLIEIWENEKVEMVIGLRGNFKEYKVIKILKMFYYKFSMLPKNLERFSDFRLLDKSIVKKIVNLSFEPPFLRHYLDSSNFISKFIDIEIPERVIGNSKFTIMKLLFLGLESFIFLRINYIKFFITYISSLILLLIFDKVIFFYFLNLFFLFILFLKLRSSYFSRKVSYKLFIRGK